MTKKVNTWWNSRSLIIAPCMNCKDRTPTCHGPSCKRYSDYKAVKDAENREDKLRRSCRTGDEYK